MVIGMGGVGSVIGQKLHEYDCFERILLADVDPTFAEHLREKTKSSRFQVCTVNAMDTAKLITLMRDHGIAVTLNACPWQANHSVLEACHRAGSHYLDMAADIYSPPGLKRPTKNSFEAEIEKFNQPFLDKGIAGILCMGMDPGAVNVFARWAMDRLDTATSIRVLDADNAEVKGYRFAVLFSPETLFEELGATPYFVKDGKVTSGRPLETEIEWVRFPDPIGLMKAYAVAHEEGVSLGIYPPFVEKGVGYSVFKYTLSDKVVSHCEITCAPRHGHVEKSEGRWSGGRAGAGRQREPAQARAARGDSGRLLMRGHRGAWREGRQTSGIFCLHDG